MYMHEEIEGSFASLQRKAYPNLLDKQIVKIENVDSRWTAAFSRMGKSNFNFKEMLNYISAIHFADIFKDGDWWFEAGSFVLNPVEEDRDSINEPGMGRKVGGELANDGEASAT